MITAAPSQEFEVNRQVGKRPPVPRVAGYQEGLHQRNQLTSIRRCNVRIHDRHKRDLQFEAKAHFAVQKWIDTGGLESGTATTAAAIQEIHQRFCELLPEDLLWVEDPTTRERLRVAPGEIRKRDVQVGPISQSAQGPFLVF